MFKTKLSLLIAISAISLPLMASAGDFIYPLDQIAAPSCRFQTWSSLSGDCKMGLPKITNADYEKYKSDKLMRRVYSVLWWATYDYGWDVWMWSHEWVDIATSEGTPVRAIGDGTVIIAGKLSGWGNSVTIKHSLGNGKYLFSNYSHLSKISISKGDSVKSGTTIGEVGNTGNSYGNHLHFQLDVTDQNHPYYFLNCGKWVDPVTLVNQWLCRDFLTANTIDPILFLERGEVTYTNAPEIIKKTQELQKQTPKIEQKNIKSREQILDEEIDEFLNVHKITVSRVLTGNNAELGKTYNLELNVSDYRGRPFTGSLPITGLTFSYDRKALRVFPEQIIAIDGGARDFSVTGLKSGSYPIDIKIGKRLITTLPVNVYKPGELSKTGGAMLLVKSSIILGEKKLSGVVMKTKYGTNQLDIPYGGTYTLRSTKGKVKFCNVSRVRSRNCDYSDLVEELTFTYDDTYRGVLVFNMVAQDFQPISLAVYRVGEKKALGTSARDISVENPLGIDKNYPYFSEALASVKKSLLDLNQGYITQDRDLTGGQMKSLIRNYLSYLTLAAGKDTAKKESIRKMRSTFEDRMAPISEYDTVSRIQMARLLAETFGTKLPSTDDKKWLDEAGTDKDVITTLRVRYGLAWRDQFGENYFQPDRKLTIGEAAFLLETFDSKRHLYVYAR